MKIFTKCVPLFTGNSDEFEPGQYVLLSEAQARITELETAISDVLAGKPKYWPDTLRAALKGSTASGETDASR